jgi:hypothetical protein
VFGEQIDDLSVPVVDSVLQRDGAPRPGAGIRPRRQPGPELLAEIWTTHPGITAARQAGIATTGCRPA